VRYVVVIIALMIATLASNARADARYDARMEKIRKLYVKGDYEGVRTELLEAYDADPKPGLLFALGQVELNLGNYQAAIDYYDKFLATSPEPKQAALAQQAIGAARIRLSEPDKPPPEVKPLEPEKPDVKPDPPQPEKPEELPPPQPRWTVTHTGFVVFGSAAALLGAGLLYYSHTLGNDHSGSLMDYDSRLSQARTTRLTGAGIAIAGTLIIGVTVVW
jgi:tetratricopeptide (TPR) repeat protein